MKPNLLMRKETLCYKKVIAKDSYLISEFALNTENHLLYAKN